MIMELEVVLDFACWCCTCDMGVTLKCAGKGLTAGSKGVASVKVPCPTCGSLNQLYFEPASGELHQVGPCWDSCRVPEPSLN